MVLTPERVVLAEARRTHTLLALFGYAVDAVVVNRVVTSGSDDPLVADWRRRQEEVLGEIAGTFGPVPRFMAPLGAGEPVGVEALAELAGHLYGPADPAAVLYDGPRLELVEEDGGHTMRVPLPQGTPDDVELFQRRDELFVRVGGYTRNLVLPSGLGHRTASGARVEHGWLCITFAGDTVTADDQRPTATRV
jgi:arsenite-transporting ATPase